MRDIEVLQILLLLPSIWQDMGNLENKIKALRFFSMVEEDPLKNWEIHVHVLISSALSEWWQHVMDSKIQLFIIFMLNRKGALRLRPRHKDGDVLRVWTPPPPPA